MGIPAADDKPVSEDITIQENVSKYDQSGPEEEFVRPLTDGMEEDNLNNAIEETRVPVVPKPSKPFYSVESLSEIDEPENTHFLIYFLTFVVLSATGYVL